MVQGMLVFSGAVVAMGYTLSLCAAVLLPSRHPPCDCQRGLITAAAHVQRIQLLACIWLLAAQGYASSCRTCAKGHMLLHTGSPCSTVHRLLSRMDTVLHAV
jgi:hypothetical protein